MGVLTRELLEFGLVDGNSLIKAVIAIGPLTELKSLREHYLYNINPWGPTLPQAVVEKQLKLYSRQSIALDISALKKQYAKLKQRQRQAHIIFSAAISRQSPPSAPVTMNHLLLGKSALVPAKRLGPPKGTIPPARQIPSTLLWKDAPKQTSSSSSSDTELCDDDSGECSTEEEPDQKSQFDDNLPTDSDNILMRTDNTTSVTISASEPETTLDVEPNSLEVDTERSSPPSQSFLTENPEISATSDTFDTSSYAAKVSSESDDENFDFERFLADRVKCLKEDNTLQEDDSDERVNCARRNSAKALQIIQENSLILHRILQCQSRLSPSPPPIHVPDDTHTVPSSHYHDPVLLQEHPQPHSKQTDMPSPDLSHESLSEIDTTTYPDRLTQILFDNTEEMKSPEYGSRYTSILEKSKSLDEKYNALILNIPPLKQSVSEQKNLTRICEEKSKLNSDTFKQDETFKLSTFPTENILLEGYNVTSLKKCDETSSLRKETSLSLEGQSNNSPNLVSPKLHYKNYDPRSPEQYDSATTFTEKICHYPESKISSSMQYPTADYGISDSYQTYKDFSYHLPIEVDTGEHATSEHDSFSWKNKLDDTISTAFDFSDFTSSIDDTDSGTSFVKSSTFHLNLPPLKSPKCPSADSNEFTPTENGHDDKSNRYSFSFQEEQESKSGERSTFYEDLMSQLNSYPQSLQNKIDTIPKENSSAHSSLKSGTEETKEKPSSQSSLESQNELKKSSGYSTNLNIKCADESNKKSLTLTASLSGESSSSKSPLKSPLKSPGKAFNPFPVPLSSRQSKEVPLKLGLYKK